MANATKQVRITPRQTDGRSVPVYLADGYTFYNGTVLTVSTVDGYARPATQDAYSGAIVEGILAPKSDNLLRNGKIVTVVGDVIASDVIVGVFDMSQDGSVTQASVGSNIYLLNDYQVTTSTTSGIQVPCVALNSDGTVQVFIGFKNLVQ